MTGKILIEKLNPHPKNNYYFSDIEGEKYEEIKRSIATYGIRDEIIITTNYTIISGHQRLRIAKDLGITEVPVEIKDVDEWEAEYLLIAYNTERRGEAEKDPIKKGRQAAFLKEYWGIKNNNNNIKSGGTLFHQKSMKDVAESIQTNERTARTLIKLNDLIPQLQQLVSNGKLGTRAAEQLAFLTEEEQTILFKERGDSIGDMTVDEAKKLRKEIEDLREENKKLKNENNDLKTKVKTLESKKPKEIIKEVVKEVDKTDYDKLRKLEQQLEKERQEIAKYKEHVVELKSQIDNYKNSSPYEELSPQAKIFMKRHLEIAEDCHKLIEKVSSMTIIPPSDLPVHMMENYKKLFYETGNLLMKSYEKLSNQQQIIDIQ